MFAIAMSLFASIDGGHDWKRIAGRTHGDYHMVWRSSSSTAFRSASSIRIQADNRQPFYHLFGGLQDNGTHSGPSRNRRTGIPTDDRSMVSWGDGFHAINDPDDPDLYLSENQGGGIVRTNMKTRDQQV